MAIKDRHEEKKICEDIIRVLDKSHKLIDADAFRHRLLCQPPKNISINYVLELVSTMHTVDAEIVNHGRWIGKEDKRWHCSECDGIAPKGYRYNYCPDCGAKMDVE